MTAFFAALASLFTALPSFIDWLTTLFAGFGGTVV